MGHDLDYIITQYNIGSETDADIYWTCRQGGCHEANDSPKLQLGVHRPRVWSTNYRRPERLLDWGRSIIFINFSIITNFILYYLVQNILTKPWFYGGHFKGGVNMVGFWLNPHNYDPHFFLSPKQKTDSNISSKVT